MTASAQTNFLSAPAIAKPVSFLSPGLIVKPPWTCLKYRRMRSRLGLHDLHLGELGAGVDQVLFAVDEVAGRQRQPPADFLLVARMDVLGVADVDGHRQAGVGDRAHGAPLRFADLRPARLDRVLLQRIVIGQRHDQEREIPHLEALRLASRRSASASSRRYCSQRGPFDSP